MDRGTCQFLVGLASHAGHRRQTLRWLWSYLIGDPVRLRQPYLVFDATDYLAERHWRGRRVFEYGSGGSTCFFADRGARVTAVEHEPVWAARVRQRAPADVRLVVPDLECVPAYASTHETGRSFLAYVSTIDGFEDETFDLVLVDGRARVAAVRHAMPKVRPGGLLVLDDADRPRYSEAIARLAGWTRHRFTGPGLVWPGYWQTDVYVKPGAPA